MTRNTGPQSKTRRWTSAPEEHRSTTALIPKRVGHSTGRPETLVEKVNAIHDLACDEQVAATAATDLLRRPEVSTGSRPRARAGMIAYLTSDDQLAATVAHRLRARRFDQQG